MSERDWDEHYATGQLPWDTGEPDGHLVDFLASGRVASPGRALDVGCGTGTNAIHLAEQGFEVLGVDVSPLAVERARQKLDRRQLPCRFEAVDFLASGDDLGGPFAFVFDRGCFHVFDAAERQARFAARVAHLLAPGGLWLSLIGSTEGAPRDTGPPRRSARDVVLALEPALELLELRSSTMHSAFEGFAPMAWICVARRREQPAQPSTVGKP
ncbi:MAG: class I SAM-dependent methyltransferase [Planctomycetota bacterium]